MELSKQNEAVLNCKGTRKLHELGNTKKWLYSKHTYTGMKMQDQLANFIHRKKWKDRGRNWCAAELRGRECPRGTKSQRPNQESKDKSLKVMYLERI